MLNVHDLQPLASWPLVTFQLKRLTSLHHIKFSNLTLFMHLVAVLLNIPGPCWKEQAEIRKGPGER